MLKGAPLLWDRVRFFKRADRPPVASWQPGHCPATRPWQIGREREDSGPMLSKAKEWARSVKRDTLAIWIAARDSRVPWYAKAMAAGVAAYALSPIDLIPDFIPVLGYLDDLIVVPVGVLLVVRMIPADLVAEFRRRAAIQADRPVSYAGAAAIGFLWLAATAFAAWWLWPRLAIHLLG